MSPLPRRPVSAGARPCPGRSSSGLTALRGLHLDTACAPAFTWQLTRSRDNQDQPIEVSTLSGEPQSQERRSGLVLRVIRSGHRTSLPMDMGHRTGPGRNCSAVFTMTWRCSWWRLCSYEGGRAERRAARSSAPSPESRGRTARRPAHARRMTLIGALTSGPSPADHGVSVAVSRYSASLREAGGGGGQRIDSSRRWPWPRLVAACRARRRRGMAMSCAWIRMSVSVSR